MKLQINLLLFLFLYSSVTLGQSHKSKDYWLSFVDTVKNKCGYVNQHADTVIKANNYNDCFTDTFKTYAIVMDKHFHFVAIDRKQNVLCNVYVFDNGPDYASDGTFRILQKKKIGYADEATGKIIINPQYGCAFPFENGVAKVSINCKTDAADPEHPAWIADHWIYIDKKGRRVVSAGSKKLAKKKGI